jgi:vancomycin aglycone glucosyltransferase
MQLMADQMIRGQFEVITKAAGGCDLIVGAGALQLATRSIAEKLNIPYVFAAYCPAVLPSLKNPPPKTGGFYPQALPEAEIAQLWKNNEEEFMKFAGVLNEERAKFGLAPVESVQRYMFTERPWLAADPVLAPAFPANGLEIVQTGAWMIDDQSELPADLEDFLTAGTAPIYLGFGSMRASDQTGRMLVEAARALGIRCLLSRGWANLLPVDASKDCFSISEVSHARLFPRVAAIVHHGGAGTTQTAVRAGRPQVIIPHNYDQFYWAHRVQELGVGVSGPLRDDLGVEALATALRECLRPGVTTNAQELATRFERNGARIAAKRLIKEFK